MTVSSHMKTIASLFLAIFSMVLGGCITASEHGRPIQAQVFGWPFLEPETMQSRGGTSQGSPVTLSTNASPYWTSLQENGLSAFEQDRRAILAMQGSYRTSFQFIETAGFSESFSPARPYFSWGTEVVHLLEDKQDFISLQHTMVMYFVDEDGSTNGPMVMKHWRQDWQYEAPAQLQYTGNRRWQTVQIQKAEGRWLQSVYQVDDSPRYQALGRWTHDANYSAWESDAFDRPLPRREYSVREDYTLLRGTHRITITPTGWVHEQHNRKVNVHDDKETTLAVETGINRYESITAPDLYPASDEYWQLTGNYWSAVRDTWNEIIGKGQPFSLTKKVDDQSLFMHHFGYAASITDTTPLNEQRQHARDTIMRFLQDQPATDKPGY
jgi:hypothetical protein